MPRYEKYSVGYVQQVRALPAFFHALLEEKNRDPSRSRSELELTNIGIYHVSKRRKIR